MTTEKMSEMLKEYQSVEGTYGQFCTTISFLLETLLRKHSFQFQVVSSRVKEEKSVENKLMNGKLLATLNSLTDLDDIAGCRIIFYLESEIQRFVHHVYEEFEVVKNNLRYSNDDYNAYHLVIKFKEDRLRLTEYAQFRDYKCELQLTTVLFHAWSEVSHNITYKSPKELVEFDSEKIEFLKNELKEIMRNFIKPANYKFEFLNQEYLSLLKGKEVLGSTFLTEMLEIADASVVYGNVVLLRQYIEKYGDKTPTDVVLTEFLVSVINHSQKLKEDNQGKWGMRYSNYIIIECIDILNVVKYQYPDKVFPILVQLSLHDNLENKNKALETIKKMSKYRLKALQKIGLSLHYFLLDQIESWKETEKVQRIEVIKTVFSEIFELEFEHNEMTDYKTLSFGFGMLQVNDALKRLRERAIHISIELFDLYESTSHKLSILSVMNEATKTPTRGNYSEDIESIVKENTIALISRYIEIISKGHSLLIVKAIEEQGRWFRRRYQTIEGLDSLIEIINRNEKYVIFRDFVGYDHDYLEESDWRKARELRIERINGYSNSIADEFEIFWIELILEICDEFTVSEQGKYYYFNQFLFEVACKKPRFAKGLLETYTKEISYFLHHILAGLEKSNKDYAQSKINEFIESGQYLLNCTLSLLYSSTIDIGTLNKIFEKSLDNTDFRVMTEIVRLLNTNNSDKMEGKALFLKVITELSRNDHFWWTNHIWYDTESILNYITEEEYSRILEVMVSCPEIDHHVCQLLIPVAQKTPTKIIDFFENRVFIEESEQKDIDRYDAIPYHLSGIGEILRDKAEQCIEPLYAWFRKDTGSFKQEASNLFQKIFPSFDKSLEVFLTKILQSKDIKDAKIILRILGEYNGDTSIFPFCQQFVIAYSKEPDMLREMMYVLSKTGVVTGEYGFSEALKGTKKAIRNWNKSENESVRMFVKDFIDYLNANITHETKRSDESIQRMQQDFELKS